MAYRIKSRYYADEDQFGESYVVTSDNSEKDTRFEIGEMVEIERVQPEGTVFCRKCTYGGGVPVPIYHKPPVCG